MSNEKLTWTTEFITSENLMIQIFSDRIKVVSNIKTGNVKVLKDDNVVATMEDMHISDYDKFVIQIAIDANDLSQFATEE